MASPPSRRLELGELRSLVVVADAGTIGRAAVRLHVSQPTLSKRLQTLERHMGAPLLERSQQGVALTPAGRRLYEHAKPLIAAADALDELAAGRMWQMTSVRLAASHSAAEAFVADALGGQDEDGVAVELLTANSQIVRTLVGEGRADVGVAAGRPGTVPSPAVREQTLVRDAVVCAVPRSHPWAGRELLGRSEFLRTPMVLRDRSSNARATVERVLRRERLQAAPPLCEASTPAAAKRQALARNAPTLLSRHVLSDSFAEVPVDGLRFDREYRLVLPAVGEPPPEARAVEELLRAAAADLQGA
jgi:DNA-binding transcriptional LysR family regulator